MYAFLCYSHEGIGIALKQFWYERTATYGYVVNEQGLAQVKASWKDSVEMMPFEACMAYQAIGKILRGLGHDPEAPGEAEVNNNKD